MLRRSRELFRWSRERMEQSERFTEPSIFHQLLKRWDSVVRNDAPPPEPRSEAPPTNRHNARRRWIDLTR
jgi:hypothetical protein